MRASQKAVKNEVKIFMAQLFQVIEECRTEFKGDIEEAQTLPELDFSDDAAQTTREFFA